VKKTPFFTICILFSFCAFTQVGTISVDKFEEKLTVADGVQLIDTRSSVEFGRYRIPGAVNISLRDPKFQEKMEQLDRDKPVLIYCLIGTRTKRVMTNLRRAGFKTVYELEGGIDLWLREGKSIEN